MPHRECEVASLDELTDGATRSVEIDGEKILLIRDGNAVHAVGATCRHAGGPLDQGVRRGNRLVCPWHKATFCIRTGAVLEPPALDRLPRYRVHIEGQRVLLAYPADPPVETEPQTDPRCFVIIGAGAAGAVAAQTLRETGFSGRIIMLDRENRVPYDRTVLSKSFLSGEKAGEKSPLQSQSFYRQHRIERRTAEVTHLNTQQRQIQCTDGSLFNYDAALLATGGRPKRADIPGAQLGNVFLLRSRADADAILAQAERSERAVILGGSFIGMEVAASLRERGLGVTVVSKEAVPFAKQLGPRIGTAFVKLHEARGMCFRLGRSIERLEGHTDVRTVVLDGGEMLPADLVVIGFGIQPVTDYLDSILLNDDGSIPVDSNLRVTDGLYAAGDIAKFPMCGDAAPIRVEHWRVAQQHGRVAALNMAGQAARYDVVPVFWTIQYLKRLDYIGYAPEWDDIVIHGSLEKPEFLAYYVKDGRVIAAAGMDRDKDTAALIELFNMHRNWTPAALGDRPASVLMTMAGASSVTGGPSSGAVT